MGGAVVCGAKHAEDEEANVPVRELHDNGQRRHAGRPPLGPGALVGGRPPAINTNNPPVIRLSTPHQMLHPNFFFGSRQQEGDIDFKPEAEDTLRLQALSSQVPTIAVLQMSRPAIITDIIDQLDGVYVDLGVADDVLLTAIIEGQDTEGRLPFELPSSMAAVEQARSDLPCDSKDPLFSIRSDYRNV